MVCCLGVERELVWWRVVWWLVVLFLSLMGRALLVDSLGEWVWLVGGGGGAIEDRK